MEERLFVERGAVLELHDGVFIGSQGGSEGTCIVFCALDKPSHLNGGLFQLRIEQDVDGGRFPAAVWCELNDL